MDFWEHVSIKVRSKINITETQYNKALEEQENAIIDFLSFNCCPEVKISSSIWEIKKEILTLYTREIAPAISEIEVFSHTLHASAVEAVFNLLQYIIAAEFAATPSEALSFYTNTLSYTYFLKFELQKSLSELLFDRIKSYRKMIKNFNHSGVLIDYKPFLKVVNKRVHQAKKQYRVSRKKLRSRIKKAPDRVAEINLQTLEKTVGFDSTISSLKSVIEQYEDKLPIVVGNGYNMSSCYRFISRTLSFFSAFFVFYGLMQYFSCWDPFVTYILDFFVRWVYA